MLTETEWDQAQQRVTTFWHRGDFTGALAEIDKVLGEGTPEMKGQALLYRGMIRDDQGDLDTAKRDVSDALNYAGAGTYARYVAERTLGELCDKLGQRDAALGWYRAALRTCAQGDEFSGGLALDAFLRLRQQSLPDDDALVASVAKKSWRVLELPGAPDLKDLSKTAETLANKARKA